MKKVITSKKAKKNISAAIVVIGLLGLLGKVYVPVIVNDTKELINEWNDYIEDVKSPVVEVPSSIKGIDFRESEVVDDKEKYANLEDLKKYQAYLVYRVDGENVFYDVQFLNEVIDRDYIAYYKSLDGGLEALDTDGSTKLTNKGYIKYDVVYLGEVYEDLDNPLISEYVQNGIDLENGTITRSAYVLYELGYISRHKDQVFEEVEKIRKTRVLK